MSWSEFSQCWNKSLTFRNQCQLDFLVCSMLWSKTINLAYKDWFTCTLRSTGTISWTTVWKSSIKSRTLKLHWEYLSLANKVQMKEELKMNIFNWSLKLFSILIWTCSYPSIMEEYIGSMDFHINLQSDFSL